MIPNLTLIVAAYVVLAALDTIRKSKDSTIMIVLSVVVILIAIFATEATFDAASKVTHEISSLP